MGHSSDYVCQSSHTSIIPPSTLDRFTNYHCSLSFWFGNTRAHKHDRKFSAPSSETQGQIVGRGKVRNWPKKKDVGEEKSRAKREVTIWNGKGFFNLFPLFHVFSNRLRKRLFKSRPRIPGVYWIGVFLSRARDSQSNTKGDRESKETNMPIFYEQQSENYRWSKQENRQLPGCNTGLKQRKIQTAFQIIQHPSLRTQPI